MKRQLRMQLFNDIWNALSIGFLSMIATRYFMKPLGVAAGLIVIFRLVTTFWACFIDDWEFQRRDK